jgi:hypothetical protein
MVVQAYTLFNSRKRFERSLTSTWLSIALAASEMMAPLAMTPLANLKMQILRYKLSLLI